MLRESRLVQEMRVKDGEELKTGRAAALGGGFAPLEKPPA